MTARELIVATGAYLIALVAVAWFTRAAARRVAGALAGGAVVGLAAIGVTALAQVTGWWRVPGFLTPDKLPVYYLGWAISCAPIYLITWRIARRFGRRGLATVLAAVAVVGPLRDYPFSAVFPEWTGRGTRARGRRDLCRRGGPGTRGNAPRRRPCHERPAGATATGCPQRGCGMKTFPFGGSTSDHSRSPDPLIQVYINIDIDCRPVPQALRAVRRPRVDTAFGPLTRWRPLSTPVSRWEGGVESAAPREYRRRVNGPGVPHKRQENDQGGTTR